MELFDRHGRGNDWSTSWDFVRKHLRTKSEECRIFLGLIRDSGRILLAESQNNLTISIPKFRERQSKFKSKTPSKLHQSSFKTPIHIQRQRQRHKDIGAATPLECAKGAMPIPSLADITSYCSERKNNVDPEAWLAYYQSNGWRVGRNAMKDWRAAVRTWEKNGYSHKNTAPQNEEKDRFAQTREAMAVMKAKGMAGP